MIHSASPTPPTGSDCCLIFKFWDGRTDRRHVQKQWWTVVGLVDQKGILCLNQTYKEKSTTAGIILKFQMQKLQCGAKKSFFFGGGGAHF